MILTIVRYCRHCSNNVHSWCVTKAFWNKQSLSGILGYKSLINCIINGSTVNILQYSTFNDIHAIHIILFTMYNVLCILKQLCTALVKLNFHGYTWIMQTAIDVFRKPSFLVVQIQLVDPMVTKTCEFPAQSPFLMPTFTFAIKLENISILLLHRSDLSKPANWEFSCKILILHNKGF